MHKARFLVTFKKAVYANNRKVKVYDCESKQASDEPRDGIVLYIKTRLSSDRTSLAH